MFNSAMTKQGVSPRVVGTQERTLLQMATQEN